MEELETKIKPIGYKSCTPKWVINELADKIEDIEEVIVLARFKNNFSAVLSSKMSISDMCVLKEVLTRNIWNRIDEENNQAKEEGNGISHSD